MGTIVGLKPSSDGGIDVIDNISGGTSYIISAFGFRSSVSVAVNGDDVWVGTATTLPIPPDIGEQMQVVSTSINDDGSPVGTGVRTLNLHYIDANGAEQEETIIMNGTTPVLTVATNIRFVQEIHSITVGSNGVASGSITISKAGDAATVYSQISAGFNRSLNTARMIPSNKVLIIRSWGATGGAAVGGKSAEVRLRITHHNGILLPRVFLGEDNILTFNSGLYKELEPPIIAPPLSIVKCTSYSSSGGSDIQASWRGVLVPVPT